MKKEWPKMQRKNFMNSYVFLFQLYLASVMENSEYSKLRISKMTNTGSEFDICTVYTYCTVQYFLKILGQNC